MNVLIVDDNQDIRKFIKVILSKVSYVEVIHEASTPAEVFQKVANFNYNVVFLDVDLGENVRINGIQLGCELRKIVPDLQIIFSTAYREFAIDAFVINATDYILKPFNEIKVINAINKAKRNLPIVDRLKIKTSNGIETIELESIILIEKTNRKLEIISSRKIIETYDTITSFESKLPDNFFKSHKSFIINLHKIVQVIPEQSGIHKVKFSDTERVAYITRAKYREFCNIYL